MARYDLARMEYGTAAILSTEESTRQQLGRVLSAVRSGQTHHGEGNTDMAQGCTCHSIREFSGGHFGSLAMLGVECPACEAINAEYEWQDWWNNLTESERIAERWRNAVSRVSYSWQRRPMAKLRAFLPEPPF